MTASTYPFTEADLADPFTEADLADPFTFLTRPEINRDPFPAYAFMRESAPLLDPNEFKKDAAPPDGSGSLLYVTSYELIKQIMENPTSTTRSKAMFETYQEPDDLIGSYAEHSLLQLEGETHAALRKILNESFKPRRIRKLRGELTGDVDGYLDAVSDVGEMDVVASLSHPFTITAIMRLIGFSLDELDEVNDISVKLAGQLDPVARNLPEVRAAANSAMQWLVERGDELIVERRANPQDDVISDLVAVMDGTGSITARDIHGSMRAIITAGHLTTTDQIGNNLLSLMKFPDQIQKLREDPSLAPSAVEELLRYDPSITMTWRGVTEPWEVAGRPISEGDIMFLFDAAANRDPAVFPNPDKVDITRKGAMNLTSGGGPHYCLGATLARMEAEVSLMRMLERFKSFELQVSADELPRNTIVSMHGVTELPISFELD